MNQQFINNDKQKYFINVYAISSTYACNIWLLFFIYTCIYSVNG